MQPVFKVNEEQIVYIHLKKIAHGQENSLKNLTHYILESLENLQLTLLIENKITMTSSIKDSLIYNTDPSHNLVEWCEFILLKLKQTV